MKAGELCVENSKATMSTLATPFLTQRTPGSASKAYGDCGLHCATIPQLNMKRFTTMLYGPHLIDYQYSSIHIPQMELKMIWAILEACILCSCHVAQLLKYTGRRAHQKALVVTPLGAQLAGLEDFEETPGAPQRLGVLLGWVQGHISIEA